MKLEDQLYEVRSIMEYDIVLHCRWLHVKGEDQF